MTYARSESSGKDEFFQWIVPKGKITSENTLTLEAEGDPTVFSLSVKVLRPADGKMMKLVKYSLADEGTTLTTVDSTIIHNHELTGTGTNPTTLNVGSTATANTLEGLVATDQAIYDKDVISACTFSTDTITLTASSGAQASDSCTVTIYDKDGKYKAAYTAVVTGS